MGWVSIPPLHAEQVRLEQNVQLCIRWPPSVAYAMEGIVRPPTVATEVGCHGARPELPAPPESGTHEQNV